MLAAQQQRLAAAGAGRPGSAMLAPRVQQRLPGVAVQQQQQQQQQQLVQAQSQQQQQRAAAVVARASPRLAPLIDQLKADQLRSDLPEVHIGDTVRLGLLVAEGKGKTRTQRLEGVVIAESGSGSNKTVTVRRVFQGVGVEMNVLLHSPVLGSLEVLRRAKVRRAKLYYLRERTGKNARLKELFVRKGGKGSGAEAKKQK